MRDLPRPSRLFSLATCFDVVVVVFFIFKKYVVSVLTIVWNVWHPVFICAKSFFFFQGKKLFIFDVSTIAKIYIFISIRCLELLSDKSLGKN